MSEIVDQPLRTFSIGFVGFGPGENFHDLPYARTVAERFGCDHQELMVTSAECRGRDPGGSPRASTSRLAIRPALPMHFVSRAVVRQAGVTVVLVGEGQRRGVRRLRGHGAPARRPRCRDSRRVRRLHHAMLRRGLYRAARLPASTARSCIDVLRRMPRTTFEAAVPGGPRRRVLGSREVGAASGAGCALGWARPPPTSLRGFYRELSARRPHADGLQQLSWVELCNRLPELLLMRVDRLTMAHSLEARAPFLDADLVAYALSLPARLKIRGKTTKYVLRQAVRSLLPDSVLARPKQGFRVPLPEWLRGDLAGWAQHQLRHAAIHRRQLFGRGAIDRMWGRPSFGQARPAASTCGA